MAKTNMLPQYLEIKIFVFLGLLAILPLLGCRSIMLDNSDQISPWLSNSTAAVSTHRMDRGWRVGGRIYATRMIDGAVIVIGEGQDDSFGNQTFSSIKAYHGTNDSDPDWSMLRHRAGFWPVGLVYCISRTGERRLAVYMVDDADLFHHHQLASSEYPYPWKIQVNSESEMLVLVEWDDAEVSNWLGQEGLRFESAENGFTINEEGYILVPGSSQPDDFYFPTQPSPL